MSEKIPESEKSFRLVKSVNPDEVRQNNERWAFRAFLDLAQGKIPSKDQLDLANRILGGKSGPRDDKTEKTE